MRICWWISAFLALAGCSPRTLALRTTASLLDKGASAFYEEPDPELAREAMASQLKLVEALLKNEPQNSSLLELAAQGFGGYAFLFVEDAQPDRAKGFYARGRDYGVRLAGRNGALAGLDHLALGPLQEKLKQTTAADAPGLFWTAYGWAGLINLSKDSPDSVAALPKVASIMRRVEEVSPGYFHGGPNLFLGTYYSALPKMLGGDPVKSKQYFEAAIRQGEGHFDIAKVLFAKYYAVAVQDPALFKQLNEQVLASQDKTADVRLANEVAKLKAKRLMEKMNELF